MAPGADQFRALLGLSLTNCLGLTNVLRKFVLSFFLFLSCLWCGTVVAQSANSSYAMGSGDVISIRVFGEEELSFEKVRLNDAGTFSYPFLGELHAKGKTAADIEDVIADGLRGDYLIDPKVSVRILEYRDFYVNGEVETPGGYPFSPGLTVRKAVALAGGFTEWASKNNILLIREGKPESEAEKAALDTPVMPGDIITVNQSLF